MFRRNIVFHLQGIKYAKRALSDIWKVYYENIGKIPCKYVI
jgi:hypothetical protein